MVTDRSNLYRVDRRRQYKTCGVCRTERLRDAILETKMAIQKSIPTQYGVNATEWRAINVVPVLGDTMVLEVTYNGYANAQAADSGMQPLTQKRVHLPNTEYANIRTPIHTAVLKQQTAISVP